MKKSLAVLGVVGLGALSACNSGASNNTAAPQGYNGGGAQNTQQQRFPGANGEIAAVDGTTLQVQSSTDQTAVTYSAKTTITDTLATTASAVTVGSCVVVRDGNAVRSTASPNPSATRPTTVTATTVAVSAPVSGSCTGNRMFGGGGGPQGAQGTPPPGFTPPSGAPNGNRTRGGGFGGFGGGAFGKVTSVSSTGFVVESEQPGQNGSSTGTPVSTTVTTTASTTYTTEKKATSAALKVGACVSARGTADSAGTVAATSIAVRPKTNGSCDTGFGTRRG